MDTKQEIDTLAHAISTLTARHDAMSAVLAGVLETTRSNPEVGKAVLARLEQEHSIQLAKGQSEHYMHNFEVMREYFRVLIE